MADMALTIRGTGLGTNTQETNTEQGKRSATQRLINFVLEKRNTKVFFIVGLMRSGKSSLFEALTGKSGHAGSGIDSVTKEYNLGHATIDGEFYIFVDTPGFDDPRTTNEAVFRNIVDFVQTVMGSVTFAGVLYVHPMGTHFDAGNSAFIQWLEKFCGTRYSPFVTFITTKWDSIHPRLIETEMALLDQWKSKWSNFLDNGALLYQHGRSYDPEGNITGEILYIEDASDKEKRQTFAKSMISRHYGNREFSELLFVQELKQGILLHNTSAGRALGIRASSHDENSSASASNENHGGVNWLKLLMNYVLRPFRKFWAFVQWFFRFLPPVDWFPQYKNGCLEIVISMPFGAPIIVGYDPRSARGIYVRVGSTSHEEEQESDQDVNFEDTDLEDLPWQEQDDDILSELGTSQDEQRFGNAFIAAWNTWNNDEDRATEPGWSCTIM